MTRRVTFLEDPLNDVPFLDRVLTVRNNWSDIIATRGEHRHRRLFQTRKTTFGRVETIPNAVSLGRLRLNVEEEDMVRSSKSMRQRRKHSRDLTSDGGAAHGQPPPAEAGADGDAAGAPTPSGAAWRAGWDFLVPLWTWALLALAWATPSYLRLVPVLVWLVPALAGERLKNSSRWARALQSIARAKKLRVVAPDGGLPDSCIIGLHPHGRYPIDVFPWLASRPDVFGDAVVAHSPFDKFVPSLGCITALSDAIDATQDDIRAAIEAGRQVALFPGGAGEMALCTPFEGTLPLVRHTGFLRVARAQGSERNARGLAGPMVVPCFVFGMHDEFCHLLPRLDRLLFQWIGVRLPLWWPSGSRGRNDKLMVLGEPLDPTAYDSDAELTAAYCGRVLELFEKHKTSVPGYAQRRIEWLDVAEEERSVDIHVKVTLLKVGFPLCIVAYYAASGRLFKASTAEAFPEARAGVVAMHIFTSFMWAIASGVLTIRGKFRYHKYVGYAAVLSLCCLSGSGWYLGAAQINDARLSADPWISAHTLFHALTNWLFAGIAPIYVGYALAAARVRDYTTHRIFMGAIHIDLGFAFLPRVTSTFFRWLFPFLSSHANYTIAALLHIPTQVSVILASRQWRALVAMYLHIVALVLLLMVAQWHYDSPAAISLAGLLLSGGSGYLFRRYGVFEKGGAAGGKPTRPKQQ
mmetsp:Transcript_59669/g.168125  ORF Transcript_59669/g.168125 Transcript_59669/m.168125 type:complete len:692 (+) Transcript_59669:32-2107(+)